jgi:hypothetical protein
VPTGSDRRPSLEGTLAHRTLHRADGVVTIPFPRRFLTTGLTVVVLAGMLTGCTLETDTSSAGAEKPAATAGPAEPATAAPSQTERATQQTSSTPNAPGPPRSDTALAALMTLAVKGRAPMSDYDRDQFGQAWLDTNRNGCDTRNDILARDLSVKRFRPETADCVIEAGELADPYTGTTLAFIRGPGDIVDIDHVVPLGNAWVTGANGWPIRKRAALANDPLNLFATDASSNRAKGDGDAATWLPPNKAFRCAYVARQVAVKQKYGLAVTAPEKAAIGRILSTCPNQALPPDSGAPVISPVAPNVPNRTPEPTEIATGQKPRTVWYENCDAARAAGAAPVHSGDPGYDGHLDRDGDGTGCDS